MRLDTIQRSAQEGLRRDRGTECPEYEQIVIATRGGLSNYNFMPGLILHFTTIILRILILDVVVVDPVGSGDQI